MTDSDRPPGPRAGQPPHAKRSRGWLTAALVAGGVVVVITGCSANAGLDVRDVAASQLRRDMQALAVAAAAHDIPAARTALAGLTRDAATAHTSRIIDNATLARILARARTVQADLDAASLPRTSTPLTPRPGATPRPQPTLSPPNYGHDGGD